MLASLETIFLSLAETLPLPLFVLVASFIEEIIAPLPSITVLLAAGSIAAIQGMTVADLPFLAFLAAIGKLVGAVLLYVVAGKVGHFLVERYGRFFEITPESVARLQAKITNTPRDYIILTALRAFPFIPSSLLSIGGGLLQIPFRLFFISTLLGTIIRDSIVIYAGFAGTNLLRTIAESSSSIETAIQVVAIAGAIASLGYLYWRHIHRPRRYTDSQKDHQP